MGEILELNGIIGVMKQEESSLDGTLKRQAITQQMLHMDDIIANLTQRRIEYDNGTAGPLPRILQPENRGSTHDGQVSESVTGSVDEGDVGAGQPEAAVDVTVGSVEGDGNVHDVAAVVEPRRDDSEESP